MATVRINSSISKAVLDQITRMREKDLEAIKVTRPVRSWAKAIYELMYDEPTRALLERLPKEFPPSTATRNKLPIIVRFSDELQGTVIARHQSITVLQHEVKSYAQSGSGYQSIRVEGVPFGAYPLIECGDELCFPTNNKRPHFNGYRITLEVCAETEQITSEIVLFEDKLQAKARMYDDFRASVYTILGQHTTLGAAIKYWPPLKDLVPRMYLDKLNSKPKSKPSPKPKPSPEVDGLAGVLDEMTVAITSHKLRGFPEIV